MEKQAIKDLMYGGICEMMHNRKYYYRSSIGNGYSHWTDEGKVAMEAYLREMTQFIWDAEENALDTRAKDLVMAELKK